MKFKESYLRTALFAAAALSALWGYRLMLADHAPVAFNDPLEDLSYAWCVPLFSAYVLWRDRRELLASVGTPSAWGLVLLVPSLLVGYMGARGLQLRFEIVGFVGLLMSLVLSCFGTRTFRRTFFPLAFLLFCIPLHSFLDVVTVHLRLFAVSFSYEFLRGCGVDVVRQGTMLTSSSGAFAIDVAEPCSGMRSLFAMMALTAGYAYFTQPTWLRRGLLFALSIPIAIVGNVVRILSIVGVAATCSSEFATGFYHDYSGYVVFLVAISLMVAVGGVLTRCCKDVVAASAARAADAPTGAFATSALPVVAALLAIAVMAYQGVTVSPAVAGAPSVRLGEIPGFTSETVPAGEAELHTLPGDTVIDKRLYQTPNGAWFQVSLVIGGARKSSIHRPELCLPSQGFQMTSPRTLAVAGVDWRLITLVRGDLPPQGFAYTFFNQDGYRTSSHVARIFRDVWDRSFRSRIDRWAMVTVNACTADDRILSAFLVNLKEAVR